MTLRLLSPLFREYFGDLSRSFLYKRFRYQQVAWVQIRLGIYIEFVEILLQTLRNCCNFSCVALRNSYPFKLPRNFTQNISSSYGISEIPSTLQRTASNSLVLSVERRKQETPKEGQTGLSVHGWQANRSRRVNRLNKYTSVFAREA